eukprot:TRINITY_DN18710_c0_g1_i3.p1 TRINITY_DN18710_c0_g1~~TRINITY_DN18710_c0_g1_i3.p1  ORF type:complete len:410 (-),score=56.68 TRINITY_DN18710_c0_g1_i3:84-1235(-)
MAVVSEPIVGAYSARPPVPYQRVGGQTVFASAALPSQQSLSSARLPAVASFGAVPGAVPAVAGGRPVPMLLPSGSHAGVLAQQPQRVIAAQQPGQNVARLHSLQGSVTNLHPVYASGDASPGPAAVSPVSPPGVAVQQGYVAYETAVADASAAEAHASVENADALKRTVRLQEESIDQLRNELQAARANERKLASDLDAAQRSIERLSDDLRAERAVREDLEANLNEHLKIRNNRLAVPSSVNGRSTGSTPRAASRDRMLGGAANGRTSEPGGRPPAPAGPASEPRQPQSRGSPRSNARGSASPNRPKVQRDEIDSRLQEFTEKQPGLVFRRLNRGWYAFKREGDPRGVPSNPDCSRQQVHVRNGQVNADCCTQGASRPLVAY